MAAILATTIIVAAATRFYSGLPAIGTGRAVAVWPDVLSPRTPGSFPAMASFTALSVIDWWRMLCSSFMSACETFLLRDDARSACNEATRASTAAPANPVRPGPDQSGSV